MNIIKNIFFKDLNAKQAFILTFILIILYSKYLFPSYFLQGKAWAFEGYDSSLHVTSWWMYVQDKWQFPLLQSNRMNDFGGMNLAFADGIPLMGLFFKLFKDFLPEHFHYFGYWYAIVYALQALASTFFIRVLGAKTGFATVMVCLFALTWPALVLRFGHAALSAQCLLIFALAIYFSGKTKQLNLNKAVIILASISIVGLLIHPYLFPPLLSIFLILLIELVVEEKFFYKAFVFISIYLIILYFVIYLMGYISHDSSQGGGGYGSTFRLDLLSPFCGRGKLHNCGFAQHGVAEWERVNYFGLGLILLIPVALIINKKNILPFIKNNKLFLILLTGLSIYAVTNNVSFNGNIIFSYWHPELLKSITNSFRVGPRFFWMVGYFLLFITLASLLRRKSNYINLLVLIMLLIQIIDLKPINKELKEVIHKKSEKNYAQYEVLMRSVDKIVGYPASGCIKHSMPFYTQLQLVAGYYSKELNSGFQARYNLNCEMHHEKIIKGNPEEKHLYVLGGGNYGNYPFDHRFDQLPKVFQELLDQGSCAIKSDTMYFSCLKNSDAKFWKGLEQDFYPVLASKNTRDYYPLEMYNQVGKNINGFRQSDPTDAQGLLAGGPFFNFAKGKYEFIIYFSSDNSQNQEVGRWATDLWNTENNKVLKAFSSGKLMGSLGKESFVTGQFEIQDSDSKNNFAINVYNQTGKQLKIEKFRIMKK